jgi:hypothetical protein
MRFQRKRTLWVGTNIYHFHLLYIYIYIYIYGKVERGTLQIPLGLWHQAQFGARNATYKEINSVRESNWQVFNSSGSREFFSAAFTSAKRWPCLCHK